MSIQNSQQISDIKTMLVKGMNGEGIESIEKTATEGFIDTYTITYTDGTKTTFDVTNGNWGIWTSAVTAAVSATSVTINNDAIGTTSILEVYSQNASGTVITVNDIDVTPGTAVLTFPALAEATDFILHIVNGTASGGGGGGTDDYLDLTNKPQINGVTLTGNKATSDFGLVNTFQGTIAEWNQLSTAEKKAYDHASITGTGGGEYNVNKTDGSLEQTAGMPDTYPADQVMMSDGVTSAEDAVSDVTSGLSNVILKSLATSNREFTDFDTAADGGLYLAPNYKTFNGAPQSTSSDSCVLLVLNDSPYKVQICISTYMFNKIYIRYNNTGTWSAWKSISLA